MPLAPGTLLNNRYRILSILGQGGMGAVYRAVDEHLGIPVAVKENLFMADEYARQFQREANILAGLRHAGLPRVRDYFGVPNQGQYLVMDYIEGEDLRKRIEREGKLPGKEVVLIGALICEALTHLHTRTPPIVHRDIKPGNLKITPEGEAFLVDFGLAKIMSGSQATSTGARAMTPGFSPPEQYGTARTDHRTDIYSLGATLYAAITGTIPEDGLARATGKEELTPIRSIEPHANRRLAACIEKALELDPEDRFQTAEAFRQALLASGELGQLTISRLTISPPPETPEASTEAELPDSPFKPVFLEPEDEAPPPRISRPRRRRYRNFTGLAVLVVVVIGILLINWLRPDLANRLVSLADVPTPTSLATATLRFPTPPPVATRTLEPTTIPITVQLTPTRLPSPTIANTPLSSGLPQIAFASNRSGSMQIWLMNADGSNEVKLTDLPNGACQPGWSPDGDQIVFISPCMGKGAYAGARIYTMQADGKESRALPIPNNPEGDYDPAWSPDGRRIAYTSNGGGITQIYVYNFDTGETINISNARSFDSTPAWAPIGNLIAFTRKTLTDMIWLMNDKGENQVPFNQSDTNTISFAPTWTADGQLIIFSQMKSNNPIPWLQALRLRDAGTNLDFHLPPGGQDIGPVDGVSISPDGLWILYESWPDGKNHDIYRISLNGADRVQITNDAAFDFAPAWRPGIH